MIVGGRREREREREREVTSISTSTSTCHNKPLHLHRGNMAHFPSLGVAAGHTLQWINPTAATSAIHTFLQARHVPRCYVRSSASEKSCSTRRACTSVLMSWLFVLHKALGSGTKTSRVAFNTGGLFSDECRFEINNAAGIISVWIVTWVFVKKGNLTRIKLKNII